MHCFNNNVGLPLTPNQASVGDPYTTPMNGAPGNTTIHRKGVVTVLALSGNLTASRTFTFGLITDEGWLPGDIVFISVPEHTGTGFTITVNSISGSPIAVWQPLDENGGMFVFGMGGTLDFIAVIPGKSGGAGSLGDWIVGGNTLSGAGVFGTLNAHDVQGITNGVQRWAVLSTGEFGIGPTQPGTGRILDVLGDTGQDVFIDTGHQIHLNCGNDFHIQSTGDCLVFVRSFFVSVGATDEIDFTAGAPGVIIKSRAGGGPGLVTWNNPFDTFGVGLEANPALATNQTYQWPLAMPTISGQSIKSTTGGVWSWGGAINVKATNTTATNTVNNTATDVVGWTEQTDSANSFDPVTGVFTVPTGGAGFYNINAMIEWASAAATIGAEFQISIFVNGAAICTGVFTNPVDTLNQKRQVRASIGVSLGVADMVKIVVQQNSGGAIALSGTAVRNTLSIAQTT